MYGYEELAAKIEWEGGIAEAIQYGVKSDEVPPLLAPLWERATLLTNDLDAVCGQIEALIDEGIEDDLEWLPADDDPADDPDPFWDD